MYSGAAPVTSINAGPAGRAGGRAGWSPAGGRDRFGSGIRLLSGEPSLFHGEVSAASPSDVDVIEALPRVRGASTGTKPSEYAGEAEDLAALEAGRRDRPIGGNGGPFRELQPSAARRGQAEAPVRSSMPRCSSSARICAALSGPKTSRGARSAVTNVDSVPPLHPSGGAMRWSSASS